MATVTANTNDVYYAPFTAPKTFKCLGILIAIAAIITFGLGIIDVAVTYQVYIISSGCMGSNSGLSICQPTNLVYTWIGVGIWASVPVFLTGVLAAYLTDHPNKTKKWFTMLAFVSAVIFAPIMVVISALEAAMANHIYYNNSPYNDYEKLIIPVIIACIGFLEFVMSAILMIRMCFCTEDPMAKRSMMTLPVKTVFHTTTTTQADTTPVPTTPVITPITVSSLVPIPPQGSTTTIVPPNQIDTSSYFNCTNGNYNGNYGANNNYSANNYSSACIYDPGQVSWAKFPVTDNKASNFITLAGPSACSTNLPIAYAGGYKFYMK